MTGLIQMRHPIHRTTRAMILGAMALLALGCGKTAPPTELKVEVEKAPASASVAPVASTATEPATPAAPASSAVAAPAASMAQAGNDAVDAVTSATTKLINSVQALAKKGQYVALVLQSKDTPDSRGMATTVRELAEASGKADCVMADVDDPAFATLFRLLKLDAGAIPTPATLMLSTNGVVTGAFTIPPTKERFAEALPPSQPLAVLTALRDWKTVIVTAQSPTTKGNAETDKGIKEYLAGVTNRSSFATVRIALDDVENASFLRQLKIDPKSETQSVTIFMTPPMSIATKPIRGAATKALVAKAMSACSAGACGPTG